jgi:NDP-hexose-3-ketoreductase
MALRFGIIGCSSIARRRFLPALLLSTDARLERVGSRGPGRALEYAQAFGCAKHGSYEDVLADPDIDAVYISTPSSSHEEWIKMAAGARKHVLCEKPAVMSYAAAGECLRVCRENGVFLMEAYSFRFHPQHAAARKAASRIGSARFFEGQFTYPRPHEGDIRLDRNLGGGVFFDSAGYPVAAASMFLGPDPISVCTVLHQDAKTGVDSAAAIQLEFENATAQLSSGFGLHYRSTYALLGESGRIEAERAFSVQPDRAVALKLELNDAIETISVPAADQFQLMLQSFVAAVRGGLPRVQFEEEFLRHCRIMDGAWRSHREKRMVHFSEYSS